jgi:hypothetical protein
MKITSINRKDSNEYNLDLNTEPKLKQAVFDYFQLHAAHLPRLKNIAFSEFENSGLRLHTSGLIDAVDADGLASLIEDLLTKAESMVNHDFPGKQEEARNKDHRKTEIIEMAAKKLGIPIN